MVESTTSTTNGENVGTEFCLVIVTCGSWDEARALGRHLVERHLTAGAQIFPIESIYRWDGQVVEDEEVLLICKSRAGNYAAIETEVLTMHSYDVPPIYMIQMDRGAKPYLDWIGASSA